MSSLPYQLRKFDFFSPAINLAAHNLEPESLIALCKILESNKHVNLLNLSGNQIGDQGLAPVCRMLQVFFHSFQHSRLRMKH